MNRDIAIIGMAGRFPDAKNLEELVLNLKAGKDSVREISAQRIKDTTLPVGREYMVCGYLEDVDKFDHRLFNISMAEARVMDPLQRLLLEVVYETIENAGYSPDDFNGSNTSVYIGDAQTDYYTHADEFVDTLVTGNAKMFHAARIARHFNLTGNAALVDTVCSSALVAVHLACNDLLLGEADCALACGISLYLFPFKDDSQDLDIWSPDGKSRAFSARANGMSRGEMAAAVLLKPLEKAVKDNDIIYAVVKATAVNNNAQRSQSLTAPDSTSLAQVIKKAWDKAGIDPTTIGYIEAHGSGTQLGDTMEIEGLNRAFKTYTDKKKICPISTIKNNIGNGISASGIAGLIKAVLSLTHQVIFPTVHFDTPNPILDSPNASVYVNQRLTKWDSVPGGIRYAGVTSVAISGINCHALLAEAPRREVTAPFPDSETTRERYLVTVSSLTPHGLKENLETLYNKLSLSSPGVSPYCLRDIAYTLNRGRKHYPYRFAAVVPGLDQLLAEIQGQLQASPPVVHVPPQDARLIFIFSDHEEIPLEMVEPVKERFLLFSRIFNQCRELCGQWNAALSSFAFQYSVYRFLQNCGLDSQHYLAIGIGTLIDAVISGEISLAEGLSQAAVYKGREIENLEQRVEGLIQRETGKEDVIFVDMGPAPGVVASFLAEKCTESANFQVFSLAHSTQNLEPNSFLELLKSFYLAGFNLDWQGFYSDPTRERYRLGLPGYQFEKKRCWLRDTPRTASIVSPLKTQQTGTLLKEEAKTILREEGTEQKLALIWREVLSADHIKPGDDFFQLGGHSLMANQVIVRIARVFQLQLDFEEIFQHPTLRSLSQYIDQCLAVRDRYKDSKSFKRIVPVEKQEHYALSPTERRLWVLSQFDEGSIAYNIFTAYLMEGELNRRCFIRAFEALVERHESLRTVFITIDGIPRQKVRSLKETGFQVEEIDVRKEGAESGDKVRQLANTEGITPFCLSRGPLLRVKLVHCAEKRYVLFISIHHIISDGWSLQVFFKEGLTLYEAFCRGKPNLFSPLPIQYKDYTAWLNRQLNGELGILHRDYWVKQFNGDIPVVNIPGDRPRPPVKTYNGNKLDYPIDKVVVRSLEKLCRETDTTMFMVLIAAVNMLLFRYSGQSDIVIGVPVAGRKDTQLEEQVGFYVNTLALRTRFFSSITFSRLLAQVKTVTLGAYSHQLYPFDSLVEAVEINRDLSRSPLFDVMVVMQNFTVNPPSIHTSEGLKIRGYDLDQFTSQFDLQLEFLEDDDKLKVYIEYNTDLFYEARIQRLAVHLVSILETVSAHPGVGIDRVDFLTAGERHRLVQEWNNTAADYPHHHCLHHFFAREAEKEPEQIALCETGTIPCTSYGQLNREAQQLADMLLERGIGPGAIVPVLAERSLEMMVALMAILNTGAAYLPLGPTYPAERLANIIRDSSSRLVLAQERFSRQVCDAVDVLVLEKRGLYEARNRHANSTAGSIRPGELAYVIYTSGSTGVPKGVAVEHRSVVNRLHWMQHAYPLDNRDVILQKTPVVFDVSVWELFWWSMNGARVCFLAPGAEGNPAAIIEAVHRHRLSTMHFVPSMLHVFLEYVQSFPDIDKLASLKRVFASGEALDTRAADRFHQLLGETNRTRLINLYGPTEATVDVSFFNCVPGGLSGKIPIGRPIQNIQLLVLSEAGLLQPEGVPGELCISGVGLARGYLNKPELTAGKFTGNPFRRGSLMYRSGDLVQWLPEGEIEFLGRLDHQVKIRGFRIELGEIESQLLTYKHINDVVVVGKTDKSGDKSLCAYIIAEHPRRGTDKGAQGPKRADVDVSEMRKYLSARLPDYMIPNYFVLLENIPLTPNGKVDREALPAPGISAVKGYIPPRNKLEEKLVEIWSDVLALERDKISIDANFFQLGGHSLKATAVIAKIHKELQVKLPMTEFFKTPNIEGLSGYIHRMRKDKYVSIELAEKKDYYELSSAQNRLYVLQQMDLQSTSYNIPQSFNLEGALYVQRLAQTFKKLIKRHESLRTSFHQAAEKPVQKAHHEVEFEIEYHDLATENTKGKNHKLHITNYKQIPNSKSQIPNQKETGVHHSSNNRIIHHFIRPFDLSRSPLMRVGLIKEQVQKHILMFDMHHIITDGISQDLLAEEFIILYHGGALPALRLQYKDYSEWQNSAEQKQTLNQQEAYWLKTYQGEIPTLNLPWDYIRPALQSFEGSDIDFAFNNEQAAKMKTLALEQEATLYMVLLALYYVFLAKISGQEDIVVGTPVSGRNHSDLEPIIGMFVNTLALRNYPSAEKTFTQFLQEVKQRTIQAFDNQDYPLEELVEKLEIRQDTGRSPLFDTLFAFQARQDRPLNLHDSMEMKIEPYEYENRTSKFDIVLIVLEEEHDLHFNIEYSTKLFKRDTIRRFAAYFKDIVTSVSNNRNVKLKDIEISLELTDSKSTIAHEALGAFGFENK